MDALTRFPKHTHFSTTDKFFYGKFPYAVSIVASTDSWYEVRSLLLTFMENNSTKEQIRCRKESNSTSFYSEDIELLIAIANYAKGLDGVRTISVQHPATDAAKELMKSDHRVRIRKSLFYFNKWRWKVTLGWGHHKRYEEIMDWLREQFPNEGTPRWDVGSPYPGEFFLNDEFDVILMKMMFGECIASLEQVILVEELA